VIVIADDEPDTVNTLAAILEDEGHGVHRIFRSGEVMPAVRRLRPDVVILDIVMPEVTGYDLAQRIRSHFSAYRPLLIAVSGVYKKPNDAVLSRLLGFDHHLTKPADPARILELIEPLTKEPR
jgi:DNA-binding response OmpR family regulator